MPVMMFRLRVAFASQIYSETGVIPGSIDIFGMAARRRYCGAYIEIGLNATRIKTQVW